MLSRVFWSLYMLPKVNKNYGEANEGKDPIK